MSVAYTVALCTHDHADRLVRTLADVRKLHMPEAPWELLIVDNACSDTTPSLLALEQWLRRSSIPQPIEVRDAA